MDETVRGGLRLGVVVVAVLALFGMGAFGLAREHRQAERDACERSVEARDDNRAMWLFLIDRLAPEKADDPEVVSFVKYLNERLPRVICVDRKPMVVEDDQ